MPKAKDNPEFWTYLSCAPFFFSLERPIIPKPKKERKKRGGSN
jgi:hypothetical protein